MIPHVLESGARAELARYTYKPGWEFWFEEHPFHDAFVLTAEYQAPDSYDPERVIPVSSSEYISGAEFDAIGNLSKTLRWRLDRLIHRLEIHERQEWLRYDGVLLNDPHADEAL